jgi:hexosaminidase
MSRTLFRVAPGLLATGIASVLALASCARPTRPATAPDLPSHRMQNLIPVPLTVESGGGEPFAILPGTSIFVTPGDEGALEVAKYLGGIISVPLGVPARVEASSAPPPDGSIHLVVSASSSTKGPESYELTITARAVTLTAPGAAGLFYGVQTIRQLLPPAIEHEAVRPLPLALPPGRVIDSPRFAWRGAMLDVARHFFETEDVKRYIDLLAMLKMNRLHLHLADDQGWRIEIKSWPNLTVHGGSTEVGGGPGGFYTQDQYADLIAYASDRFITIVPEIDMPGHTNAALSSYPELNCDGVAPSLYTGIEVGFSALCVDKEITYKFIDDVVREIGALTPGRYFHIGGDEVKKLTDEQYRGFIERVQGIVQSHGKEAIGWDEIAPAPLLPTTIVQHWRPKSPLRDVVQKQVRLIMSPAHKAYLDMKYDSATPIGLNWAAYIEVRDAYDWDPAELVDDVPEAVILGIEAPLWSETIATMRDVEYLAFPRIAAVAEIGWSAADRRDWESFRERLGKQARRWAALGINFHRSPQVDWRH